MLIELAYHHSALRADVETLLALQQSGVLEPILQAVVLLDQIGAAMESELEESGEDDEPSAASQVPTFTELWKSFFQQSEPPSSAEPPDSPEKDRPDSPEGLGSAS